MITNINGMLATLNRKKYKKTTGQSTALFVVVFIAVLFGSMTGASLFNVSLNKIALIPLILYLIFSFFKNGAKRTRNTNCVLLLGFYTVGLLSSLFALTAPYADFYSNYRMACWLYAAQIAIFYLPLLLFAWNYKKKSELFLSFKKSIVYVCRLNIFYALIQFFLFETIGYDLNASFMAFFYGSDYSAIKINLPPLGVFIRPSGLCADAAFFGVILILGFIFEDRAIYKMLCFLSAGLAMSRAALFALTVIFVFQLIYEKKTRKTIKKNIRYIPILCVFFLALMLIPDVSNQFGAMAFRILGISKENSIDGTNRHLLYFSKSIEVFLFKYGAIQKLIGFGPRQSGTVITNFHVMDGFLSPGMFKSPWATESDFSGLILGYGMLGTFLFLTIIMCMFTYKATSVKSVAIFILIFGLMYNVVETTMANLLIIILVCCGNNIHECSLKNNELVSVLMVLSREYATLARRQGQFR